jgi:sugar lactone lactonase YvrE
MLNTSASTRRKYLTRDVGKGGPHPSFDGIAAAGLSRTKEILMASQPPAANVKILLDGVALGESPRWRDGRLWFSDWGAGEIMAVDLQGRSEVIQRMTSFPFSIDWLPDGDLLIVNETRLLRRGPDGSLTTYAELSSLSDKRWNEIVVDGRGNVYVNNIGFDFPGGAFAPGLLGLATPDGAVRRVADGVAFPNGMAITPDNKALILAESYGKKLTAFDIAADGGLSNQRVWADLGDGVPDGICIDAEGAVWYADVPNKRCVRVREGGEVLQTVNVDRGCFACMLGGAAEPRLFIVAAEWRGTAEMARNGRVLTVAAPAPKAGWP